MAKSTRSKVKRSFRSKKRESGIYAATEAARLQRLNQKLQHAMEKDQDGDQDGDIKIGSTQENPEDPAHAISTSDEHMPDTDSMQVDSEPRSKRISTHGARNSRREEWRKSKGMVARPARNGMNRQGGVAARRKGGRSSRRR